MKKVTIFLNARNEAEQVEKCITACMKQTYNKKYYKVFVVDDASRDNTGEVIETLRKKFGRGMIWYKRMEKRQGRVRSANIAAKAIDTPYIIEFNPDCTPERTWLSSLMRGFTSSRIGVVKSTSIGEGVSSAYRKDVLRKAGLFDERFNEFGSSFRYDTDMMFRILDLGFEIKIVSPPGFFHEQPRPESVRGRVRYAMRRVWIHRFDPLLYRNNPERAKEFLKIRFGFMRDPFEDFKTATGLWTGGKNLAASSPQGVVLLENKGLGHTAAIFFMGLAYVFLVKAARLYGSFKFGKLLL